MTITLLTGDCRDVLPTLPSNSVHCCVCSPPYYGLRDYGTAQWEGGDAACSHTIARTSERSRVQHDEYAPPSSWTNRDATPPRQCSCGARRIDRQLGLEATPDEYLAAMVDVFREVRRVLRPDGTVFLNIGDSYAGSWGNQGRKTERGTQRPINGPMMQVVDDGRYPSQESNTGKCPPGLKPKDLLLMPARLALALQADGWFIRSQMPWLKRSCMPESATDRPTSAIEYVFMLTKSPRYFWDQEAVKRRGEMKPQNRFTDGKGPKAEGYAAHRQPTGMTECSARNFRNSDLFFDSLEAPYGMICDGDGLPLAMDVNPAAFTGAHFATFPPRLIEPLIRAGTSERGCCAACGAPWVRVTDVSYVPAQRDDRRIAGTRGKPGSGSFMASGAGNKTGGWNDYPCMDKQVTTTGWRPSCQCEADTMPCTVLDPFAGSGTTLLVADRLQRNAIGIDLSTTYADMAQRRIEADCPLFTSWAPAEDPEDARMRDLFAEAAE